VRGGDGPVERYKGPPHIIMRYLYLLSILLVVLPLSVAYERLGDPTTILPVVTSGGPSFARGAAVTPDGNFAFFGDYTADLGAIANTGAVWIYQRLDPAVHGYVYSDVR
jgi:hypothetical protein